MEVGGKEKIQITLMQNKWKDMGNKKCKLKKTIKNREIRFNDHKKKMKFHMEDT